MSQLHTLAVEQRDRAGKGSARAARRAGRVPAVIYGNKEAPELVSLAEKELLRAYNTGSFLSTVFDLDVAGRVERVVPRDIQLHPVTDRPLHVDFLRIAKDGLVTVEVPVHFTGHGEAPGLKAGGVVNVVRHEIELKCPADNVPERIDVSLAGREIGDTIHVSAVTLPPGCTPTIDRDFTIATIAPPTVAVAEPAATPAAAAPAPEKK